MLLQGATTRCYCRRTALRAGKRCCMQYVDRSTSRRPGLRRRRSSEQAWERRQPVLVAAMGHSMWLALICLCQAMDKHLLHAPRFMATAMGGLSFHSTSISSAAPCRPPTAQRRLCQLFTSNYSLAQRRCGTGGLASPAKTTRPSREPCRCHKALESTT